MPAAQWCAGGQGGRIVASSRRRPWAPPVSALTLQFLTFLAERPRSYEETMEAWRSACPRMTIWEDALQERLVVYEAATTRLVRLTPQGRAVLARETQTRLAKAAE